MHFTGRHGKREPFDDRGVADFDLQIVDVQHERVFLVGGFSELNLRIDWVTT